MDLRRFAMNCLVGLLPALLLAFAHGQTANLPAPPASAQAPVPGLPQDPAAIFAAAAPFYDLASDKLKPWHMKVSYQLYDEKSKPTSEGTYEYWWASPGTYRSTWFHPDMEVTDWYVGGRHYYFSTGSDLQYFERKLSSDLLNPLPAAKDLDPEKVQFERHEEKMGPTLTCVMVVPKSALHEQGMRDVPLHMFPTFCFDPDHPVLRQYSAFGASTVIYNKIARMQGMYLPREITLFEGRRKVLSASVDTIDGIASTAPELVPRSDLEEVKSPRRIGISSAVAQGNLLKQVRPVYPLSAKDDRVQGTVVLQATIGKDGHVHDLSVISGPSPALIESAVLSVSQWEYKPYMLNGQPVEVRTTINVVYHLGN